MKAKFLPRTSAGFLFVSSLMLALLTGTKLYAQTPTPQYIWPGSNPTYTGGGNAFPFYYAVSSNIGNKCQWLYLSNAFYSTAAASTIPALPTNVNITTVYVKPTNAVSFTFNNLLIQLGSTTLTSLTSGPWNTGLSTVYSSPSASVTSTANGWLAFTLSTPFLYTGGNLILEISQQSTGSSGMTINQFSASYNGRMYGTTSSSSSSGSDGATACFGFDAVNATPCSGKPTAGTIAPVNICPNVPFTLTLNGSNTAFGGIVYQWMKSTTSATSGFSPVGGNASSLSQTLTSPAWYYLKVTCTNSNQSDSTPVYAATMAPFYYCYCASSSSSISTYSDNIGNVKVVKQYGFSPNPINPGTATSDTLLNNGIATPLTNNSQPFHTYTTFTSTSTVPVPSLFPDTTYKMVVTEINNNTFYSGYVYAWIDYNQNQAFDATELLGTGLTSLPAQNASFNFTVPHTPKFGLTGMRVIYSRNTPVNPCGTYTYGETEDYLVNIGFPPCSGPVLPGTVVGTDTAMCPGYTFSLLDTTHQQQRTNVTYSWQVSSDGGYTYQHVPGSLGKDTLNNILFTGAVKYRLRIICQNTHDTSYSNVWSIAQKAPWKCYCYSMATGGNTDTSDLGTFVIGTNVFLSGGGGVGGNSSGAHILNPQAYRARTNYTDLTPIELYADSTYRLGLYEIIRTAPHADARISVFMDFNRDLQYEAGQGGPNDERIYTGVNNMAGFYIDTFVRIPDLVVPDLPTGLRIVENNDLNPNSPANLGCGGYPSGETEDYVVIFRRPLPNGVVGVGNVNKVSVYPNPTGGKFTVKASGTTEIGSLTLTVSDLTGRTLVNKSFDNAGTQFSTDVDMSGVAAGVYLVELRAGAQKSVSKLIVR